MEWLVNLFKQIFFYTESLLYPDCCIRCGKKDIVVCENCLNSLPESTEPPVGYASLAYQNATTRKILWLLKYGNRKELANALGKILSENILENISENEYIPDPDTMIIIPIPLSKKRLRARGYNQSKLIAEIVSQELKIPLVDGLAKVIETTPQMKLKRKQRLINLDGAFTAQEKDVSGKIVLLIDDITTTGATFNAATTALLQAKAKKVVPFAVAH